MNWRESFCKLVGHNWGGCVCHRCGATNHRWSEWQHENPCSVVRSCSGCLQKQANVKHHWKTIAEESPCAGTRECQRCGMKEDYEDHQWETGPREMYDVERDMVNLTCPRCGKTDFEVIRVLPL